MEPRGTAATHNARLTGTIAREVSVTADVAPLCYAPAPRGICFDYAILIISDHVTLPNIVSLKYRLPVGINSRRGLLFYFYQLLLFFCHLFIYLFFFWTQQYYYVQLSFTIIIIWPSFVLPRH